MVIIFVPEKETRKITRYCVRYRFSDDSEDRLVMFGHKQKKNLLAFLSEKLNNRAVVNIKIERKVYHE